LTPGAVELIDLRKSFGDVRAVDGVSLRVERGEFLTLLGPSGCGKTTTLRMIAGFEQPSEGAILIEGASMNDLPPHKRPVKTVFQQYALFPHLTIGENVAYGLKMEGEAASERGRRVAEALAMVRLPGIEARLPRELSGGQQQRVALARALVTRPPVLLLDEPLGALDLKLRQAMQHEMKTLNREVGATFIYVTHDQDEALAMSDRIAVMNEGRILQVGSPEAIYESPSSRFVANFIGQMNSFTGRLLERSSDIGVVDIPAVGLVRARLPDAGAMADPVSVVVRPEKVMVVTGLDRAPAGWNHLSGTLVDSTFLGARIQRLVRLADGSLAMAVRQNDPSPDESIPPGSPVTFCFPVEAALILAG
jgi:spermidine/putrescine transport system ATP-binding protein